MVHIQSWLEIYLSVVNGFEGVDFVQGGKNVESKCSDELIRKSDYDNVECYIWFISCLESDWRSDRAEKIVQKHCRALQKSLWVRLRLRNDGLPPWPAALRITLCQCRYSCWLQALSGVRIARHRVRHTTDLMVSIYCFFVTLIF